MYNELGHYSLVLSIPVASTCNKKPAAFVVSPYLSLLTLSLFGLLFRYIPEDLLNCNVFTHPNANAPLFHKISGTWSNHEGSPLLRCRIPSFYVFLFGYRARPCDVSGRGRIKFCSFVPHFVKNSILSPVGSGATPPFFRHSLRYTNPFTNKVRSQTHCFPPCCWFQLARNAKDKASFIDEQRIDQGIAFFLSLLPLASSNPFVRISFVCTKSLAESNPVSQDPISAIHPPRIYAGYVASAIGFCLCMCRIMNGIPALYLPMRKDGWVPGGDSGRPKAGDKALISAFPVGEKLCSGCVEAPSKPREDDNAFSGHPSFALRLHSNRSSLMLRRLAREGGPPEWGPLRPFPGPEGGTPLQFARGYLPSLWPRERLKRTGTAKRVVRNANTMSLLFRWTAGANIVVPLWWKRIRIWISTCQCFLTVGILPGSWRAYHELGRGGWWFRDPVENASSMPWVLATARIHSVIISKLNLRTLFLNMVTLLCRVSGTFFVRSGLLAPVHSSATDSARGIFLWCFFLLITSISLILFTQIKQPSSTKLVSALSYPSLNHGQFNPKPMNNILWHSRRFVYHFTRLAKLMV
uniref:Cytochrome c biogenesis FN n=1 Tax=Psilotum nudum TaxID=3240 RepID=A0A1B3TRI6_PSINU|nr:cytochrome c biogenesis FN [Psilotum nudum]AOH05926.1 cytochrome c biogenesis FN [Psilotum nudum]